MLSTENEDDPSFATLPARLRHRIDSAFDSTATHFQQSKLEASARGFIVSDESEPEPSSRSSEYEHGGFIVEDPPSKFLDDQSCIPLSEIPRALNLLELSPDDDIMGVFENAATGWGARNARSDGISIKDWRAVCAALLEGDYVDGDEENLAGDEDVDMGADSGPDSDAYQTGQLSSDTEESSTDEYEESTRGTTRTKSAQKVTRKANAPGADVSRQLTESQKAQCRQDFGRFFPHVPDNELDHQRIMIKDITRVANVLRENLKTEEILEMLEAFSSSPDKSMNLADFERMMILTKLV